MNERIRELAEQAAEHYTETFKWEYLPDIDRNIFEKFAELIVKECVGITDSLSKLYPRTDVSFDVGYTMGTARASKEIKQHFGVE